jgi:hypothetical protein
MSNQEKADLYDSLLRESDFFQRKNSKLKSEWVGNIPSNIQKEIDYNNERISNVVVKLANLFK